MKSKIKVAILGGTGKAGRYLVNLLLTQSISFNILIRNPEKFKIENSLIQIINGDARDYKSIYNLLKGCQAVISTLGLGQPPSEPTLFSQATTHILQAMQAHRITRYILITGLNVNTPFDKKGPETQSATEWMYMHYPKSTQDKQLEYDLLLASSIDWTLVRLPLIEQTDTRREIKVSLKDCPGDRISATELAQFLIEQLNSNTYVRQAPFIASS